MRFKKGSIHAFDATKYRTGLHKIPQEQRLIRQAQRGTLRSTGLMTLNTLGVRPADLAASLTKSAKRTKK